MRVKEQCTLDQVVVLISKSKLQLVGRLSTENLPDLKKSVYEDEAMIKETENISGSGFDGNIQEIEQHTDDHDIPDETSKIKLPVTATIQDKYQLPSTKWRMRTDIKRDALTTFLNNVGYSEATPSSTRMSLKEHDEVFSCDYYCV